MTPAPLQLGDPAAVYGRVSTGDQVIEGTSLDGQIERGEGHVSGQRWRLVGTFVDRGVSGALASRPELDKLVRLVEDGEVKAVVVTKLDRIARSLRHLLDLIDLFDRHGVTLIALDDPLDPSTASGRAMVQLRGVFAELERQLIRERTFDGLRRRAEGGGWPGGPAPYGYRCEPSPTGPGTVLATEEEEAAVVRLAYKLLVEEGLTTGEVAAELNRFGTMPRRAPYWTHWNLRRLLLDGRGLSGAWPWRRAGRNGRTDADEIIVRIPPILDTIEHEQLLAVLAASSTTPSSRRRYLLRRRISSPHATSMAGVGGNGGHRWYRCPHRHAQLLPPGEPKCGCGRVHAQTAEAVVWDYVIGVLSDPDTLERLAAEDEGIRRSHAADERERLATLDQRITALANELAAEYEALIEDGVDRDIARAVVRKAQQRLSDLRTERDQLLRLRRKNLASVGVASRLRTLAAQARHALETADEDLQRNIIDILDLRVQVQGWDHCDTCSGKGLISVAHDARRRGNTGIPCPDCLRTRRIPVLRISGQIPELLLVALGEGADVTPLHRDTPSAALPFLSTVKSA